VSTKDKWDKSDFIRKYVSSILLAVIALLVKVGSDDIAKSLQMGNLVQSLIADLTTKNEQTRQDIALIALNHSIGDKKPKLVVEIADRILQDMLESPSTQTSDGRKALSGIAFKIIEQRNPERAEEIRKQPFSQDQARMLTVAFPNLIYIQFRGQGNRQLAEGVRVQLQKKGLYTPEIEQVDDEDYQNDVRFFYVEDSLLAQEVVRITETFLSEQGKPRKFQLLDLSRSEWAAKASKGQVEVWINLDRP
jgi:hypothetical protein